MEMESKSKIQGKGTLPLEEEINDRTRYMHA